MTARPREGSFFAERRERWWYMYLPDGATVRPEGDGEWRRVLREADLSACRRPVVQPAPGARFAIDTDGRRVTGVGELVVRFRD